MSEIYDLYAVRYATHQERRRNENFLFFDPHDGPMPIDFFVWAVVGPKHTFIVDIGFTAEDAQARGRVLDRTPAAGLEMIGIDAGQVEHVIVTHMHWDHIGNHHEFPNARFHLQEREMAYATGRQMRHEALRRAFSIEPVVGLVREVYNDRVEFHDGDVELAPGVSIHLIGGHTDGLQVVRVNTRRGQVVLASDAAHFYENIETAAPFPIVFNVGDMMAGHRKIYRLAESPAHVVPGHDPLVLARYPAAEAGLEGIAVRLDAEPS